MDVVRITQALRQQQQNPGRLNTTRTGGSSLVASSAGSSSISETLHINTAHASMDNGVQTTPCSSPTPSSAGGSNTGAGGPISPSSSFFSSLAHFLPGSAGIAAATTVAGAAAASSSNVGEIESLLLRSMPMFGNLVSRD
ncbi:hypothetical protein BG015_006567 [Linnemannia schmuckeri]|uniref:Uncharacterized protein n=1 Tax=Linnemannia schmuckeri TaxID=64567 RepID=A0A9P5RZL8_9FUNG|nr:hypothetical protein BG015_006567 [Linnemannia schmuckeri]